MNDEVEKKLALMERRLHRERSARKEAEQLLEVRSSELFQAHTSLNEAYAEMENRVNERTLALKIARDEAMSANKAKSEFLSSMSHELRTPLNAIIGFSQLMKMDFEESAEHFESLVEIESAGQHLLHLINDVLDLSKIEAGAITLSIDSVCVDDLMQECHALSLPLSKRFGITLKFDCDSGLLAYVDPIRLKQILLNLVSNAIKYNSKNGSVHVSAARSGKDEVSISVSDTGPGIKQEDQQHLFEPFNRIGAENSEIEGTGIGLMITRQLAEMMGGDIRLQSEFGSGSTFVVVVPSFDRQQCEPQQMHVPVSAKRSGSRAGASKVLYIEDNRANLRLVEKALASQPGLILLTTMDSKNGLQLAQKERPDLILLDINLPDMDGYEVLRQLRGQESTGNIPVIAVTADVLLGNQAQAKELGFDDYIAKPISIAKLHSIIEYHLNA